MPVIVVGAEKNFAALRRRLFAGRVSRAAAQRVAEAIRLANPHVDLDRLQPGTVLTIPDLPEISAGADLSPADTTAAPVEELREAISPLLEQLAAMAERREREDAAERKRLARSLEAPEVQEAAARDDALARDLEEVRRAVAEEEDRAKARRAAVKQASAEWAAELEALKTAFG
jgi:hypothetical protein